ncbi:putative disease resistance protein RGA1 [Neltuma alba]|uniref:putative disease resistance protein RGA1 n=1 Tax=Neltuma alba TaxID=207710 RepID=UPI0010A43506|nr:putative disease resistance protein RGA1 [Prosopis alba]
MTEAVIKAALESLSSLIQKELCLFLGVGREMRRLSGVLTRIKAVLEEAEKKQLTNKSLKYWLLDLRDAAYLLDDILDECSTEALSLEYQEEVQASCLYYFNLSHVMFRCKIAKKLKGISQRLYQIDEEKSRFQLSETVHEGKNEVMERRQTTSIITQTRFFGREADKETIVDFLVGDASNLEDVSVYPVTGIGGLGKTTLAQHVFHDQRVVSHFEPRIWVCVSENFNLKRLSKDIIESATRQPCGDLGLEPLQGRVQQELGGKRYLLVLDDVWNDNQGKWDELKYVLACGSKGASILVTTRLRTVASITGTVSAPHELSQLSEDDCWELFRQRAFGSKEEAREELITIGREIVRKCNGVPLAAKTLGGLLRFQRNEDEWLRIKESQIWNLPQEEDSILPALRLSYLNLSAKLRRCFAYLAVFPKDRGMSKKKVIELWMANGFLSTDEGFELEGDGDRVWNELYLKSFFVDVEIDESAYDTWFKIHDLVHDLAQSVMGEECYSGTLENGPLVERTYHLSLGDVDQSSNLWSSYLNKVKFLKTFIMLEDYYSQVDTCCDGLLKCYHLRAFDLKFSNEVSSSIDQLKHLRYLNLSHGRFTILPDSICRLWNLLILNLNMCDSLKMLPNKLKCLKSLRHLHLEGCLSLSRMAPGMRQLTCLKTLSAYVVDVQEGFLLEEVENLNLEGTLSIKRLERVTSETDARKARLADKRLNKLELSWERNEQSQLQENEEKILEVLQPHAQLKSLIVKGYLGTQLPQWMINPTLKHLISLQLVGCKSLVCISCLAKLPTLKRLSLTDMNHVQYIDEEPYVYGVDRGFQVLEKLQLSELLSLVKLSREDGDNMFPRLSTLDVTNCPQLNLPFLPSVTQLQVARGCSKVCVGSIQNLPNLERLLLNGYVGLTPPPEKMLEGLQHLKELRLFCFPKLEVLPTGLANSKALEQLHISYCENLETITEEVLQGWCSLKIFRIWGCPKFKLSAGFGHFIALELLTIAGCARLEDIPDDLQHIMTLRSLQLRDLPNLASLPDWLGNLGLLKSLDIYECPKLMSLPTSIQSLANLKSLSIYGCPELGKRCNEKTGEDWHKIARVPYLSIGD